MIPRGGAYSQMNIDLPPGISPAPYCFLYSEALAEGDSDPCFKTAYLTFTLPWYPRPQVGDELMELSEK